MGKWTNVRLECIKELGYALMYMDYIHPDVDWEPQRSRVLALCREFGQDFWQQSGCPASLRSDKQTEDSTVYWADFKKRINDEIENMC